MVKQQISYFLEVFTIFVTLAIFELMIVSFLGMLFNASHWFSLAVMLILILWVNPKLTYYITEQILEKQKNKEVQ